MQTKNYQPNAAQKRWQSSVRQLGCAVCGGFSELHHVVGASGKENKVWIGQWFVLPLCAIHHRLDPQVNVTDWPKRFTEQFGSQRSLFIKVLDEYRFAMNDEPPVPEEVLAAIEMTRK